MKNAYYTILLHLIKNNEINKFRKIIHQTDLEAWIYLLRNIKLTRNIVKEFQNPIKNAFETKNLRIYGYNQNEIEILLHNEAMINLYHEKYIF